MLPLPPVFLNGHYLTHRELSVIHAERKIAIRHATERYALDGPRLLDTRRGEACKQRVRGRDRAGHLLVEIIVSMPWAGAQWTRRVRLVQQGKSLRNI
jgi:hypothetical protein